MIDKQRIIEIYNRFGIPYWVSGKNVTRGWVNIRCIFCDDPSNHLGVDPATGLYNCWRCGQSNSFIDLLTELTGLSYGDCKNIVEESSISFKESTVDFIDKAFAKESSNVTNVVGTKVGLPKGFELVTQNTDFPLLDAYLRRRSISIDTIIEHCCGVCRTGSYMNRLVIPIIFRGEVVSFQAADMTGFAQLKYRGAPKPYEVNNYLYNYDGIDKRMIVVEGILDSWRVGDEAVAAFTSSLTEQQKKLILAKNLDELYLCFDSELKASYKSREEIGYFIPFVPVVEPIDLPEGEDPDSLGHEKIYELIEASRV